MAGLYVCLHSLSVRSNLPEKSRSRSLLQHSPSSQSCFLAMWCGNNEILEALKYWGFDKKFTPEIYQEMFQGYDKLFHQLLPTKVKELDADRFYIHSSPYLANWGRPESWG